MPRGKKTNKPTNDQAPSAAESKQPEVMTMADISQLTASGEWLTLSEATSYSNRSKATIRSAFKSYADIFTPEAVKLIEIKGTGYPALLYIHKPALDQYITKRDAQPDGVTRQRASRGNGRKYTTYITDEAMQAEGDTITIAKADLKLAFTAKPKAPAASAEQPASDQAPATAPELELVTA